MKIRHLVLLSAALALGCKKEPPPAPAPTAPKAAAADLGPEALPARQDFEATDSTLSLVAPDGRYCVWVKQDIAAPSKRYALASVEGSCLGARTALSADGKRGALRFDPGNVRSSAQGNPAFPNPIPPSDMKDRLFEVDVAAGTAHEVPLPPRGDFDEFGFDAQGRLLALTLQHPTAEEMQAGEVRVDGQAVPLEAEGEGSAAVAHAYAWEGGAWKRIESKVTTEGADYSQGIDALKASKGLGYRSGEALLARIQGDNEKRNAVLDALRPLAPDLSATDGQWIRAGSGDGRFDVWEATDSEFPYTTGLLVFLDGNTPVKPPEYPYTRSDVVAVRTRGPYLLVAQELLGAHPRLYRGRALVWRSEDARAVTFWPK